MKPENAAKYQTLPVILEDVKQILSSEKATECFSVLLQFKEKLMEEKNYNFFVELMEKGMIKENND